MITAGAVMPNKDYKPRNEQRVSRQNDLRRKSQTSRYCKGSTAVTVTCGVETVM
jgi:hypothetical protein